ncbi:MAG: hypothetical protein MI976_29330 [Pseudomonadales bacterium]|nr:hypothetical protein [Pseudomonadales bacterium]
MIQFLVTKDLAKALGNHLKPAKHLAPDLCWRGDIVQIGTQLCVVMQEQHSQYIMVFCGLSKTDFANFPLLFKDRFWRQAAALCKQLELFEVPVLTKHLSQMCEEQTFALDPEPIEEGRLMKAMEKLERRFLYERQPLPIEGKDAFEFGFHFNSRKPGPDENQSDANEALISICINFIEKGIEDERKANDPVLSVSDNLVCVDFSRWRGQ